MTGGVSGSGLPWFKLYVDIFDHPKCEELGHELGAEDAWRYVVKLYGRVAKFRADGDLSGRVDLRAHLHSTFDAYNQLQRF